MKAGKREAARDQHGEALAEAPEVPTVAELGVPGYDFGPEIGLLAPAGMPPAILARFRRRLRKRSSRPRSRSGFLQLDIEPVGSTPADLAARIRAANEKYAQVVKASGARID